VGDDVGRLLRAASTDARVIGFAGGLPLAELFPRRALSTAFMRALHRRHVPALQYAWPEGFAPLRRRIAERLALRGAHVQADEILVTSGAQQAMAIAAQVLLRRGDAIGVDAQTYPSALDAFRGMGLRPTTSTRARVLYRMPAVANPTGAAMTTKERHAALEGRHLVIEDDAYADLRFQGAAPAPLLASARTRVLYVGTFSKTLGPGLRVGFLIVPPGLYERAVRRKADDDLQTNGLSQAIVQEYLAHHDFEAFVRKLRRHYHRRAMRLMTAVRRYLPGWSFVEPEGGFGLWVQTDARTDEAVFLRRALAQGVSFDRGSSFVCQADSGPTALRLCFSSVPETAIDEGVRRLARAWAKTLRSSKRKAITKPKRKG
jgi:2-aminoadipate transaminase